MFYEWTIKDYLKSKGWHTFYNQSAWSKYGSVFRGNDVINWAEQDMIHGDILGTGGHRGMLLAYDRKLKRFWTLEGNFNNRVTITKRRVGGFWQGRIVEDMVQDGIINY